MKNRITRSAAPLAVFTLILITALPLLAQQGGMWHFKYFAGTPPAWHDHETFFADKIACEGARSNREKSGYPVSQCYHLPAVVPKMAKLTTTTTPKQATTTTSETKTPTSTVAQDARVVALEAKRKRKMLEGCLSSCTDKQKACLLGIPEQMSCVQKHTSSCIERCTEVDEQSHNQCIHEVCAANASNTYMWKRRCDDAAALTRSRCSNEQVACEQQCRQ